jgi:hypothetical protein
MSNETEVDSELAANLKAAKSRRMYFALVLKGGADGALVVGKQKVPPALITAAKKKSGGSAVIKGFCSYEDGKYVFETAKIVAATAAQAVKAIVKRDAEMTVNAVFRLSSDPELAADEDGATGAPTAAPVATDGKPGAVSVELAKSRAGWAAAKKKIHGDMEKLSTAISAELPDEADLGAALVTYIDDMLAGLDKDLEAALDGVARAATDADRQAARTAALGVLDRYQKTIAINPGVKQVEKNPFLPLSILTPLNGTLDVIKRHLEG